MNFWKILLIEASMFLQRKNREAEKEGKTFKQKMKEEFTVSPEEIEKMKNSAFEPYKKIGKTLKKTWGEIKSEINKK